LTGVLPVQACELAPEHVVPPLAGTGFVQVLVCVPDTPQADCEHAPHELQPPLTGVVQFIPLHCHVPAIGLLFVATRLQQQVPWVSPQKDKAPKA